MKPRLPRGLDPGKPVIAQDVGTYVEKLEEFYRDAYAENSAITIGNSRE